MKVIYIIGIILYSIKVVANIIGILGEEDELAKGYIVNMFWLAFMIVALVTKLGF